MANGEPAVQLQDLNGRDISRDCVSRSLTRTAFQLELRQVVEKAYLGAFLLTANVELAETAVTACIDAVEIEDLKEVLPLGAARLALQLQRNGGKQAANNTNLPIGALPTELARVLQLPSDVRQCFVLRLLTGVALPTCSEMLEMDSEHISTSAGVAALELARAVAPNAALSGR
jgi:hypothetical protein